MILKMVKIGLICNLNMIIIHFQTFHLCFLPKEEVKLISDWSATVLIQARTRISTEIGTTVLI